MDLTRVPVPPGPPDTSTAERLAEALRAAVSGTGPAVLPVVGRDGGDTGRAAGGQPAQRGSAGSVPDGVALVVRTSGSTGTPREVLLDGAALRASADATHVRLGGPGRWVLALPVAHVAGLQVLLRSALAGHDPVVVPGPFDPVAWLAAVGAAPPGAPLHASLVPTQLHRLVAALDGAEGAHDDALARLGGVLLGGAAAPAGLVARARALGLPVVTTYGMTETCGGCVYDGVPLDGVEARTDDDGVLLLAGPVLARGYRDRPDLDAAAFVVADGRRWFRTQDLGTVTGEDGAVGGPAAPDGAPPRTVMVTVLGRRDDVLVTGGAKVAPAAVEAALAAVPGVVEVCVVGVPDVEWGQAVTAVVVPGAAGVPELRALRDAARTLGRAAGPRHLVVVDRLPVRGPGKVDRAAVGRLAADAVRAGTATTHDAAGDPRG